MKIIFFVGKFPTLSETFILDQIKGMFDLGHDVWVVSLYRSQEKRVHSDVVKYGLLKRTLYVDIPEDRPRRVLRLIKVFFSGWRILFGLVRVFLKELKAAGLYEGVNRVFKAYPFLRLRPDVIHCHFGPYAKEVSFIRKYLPEIGMIVTFHRWGIRVGLSKEKGFYDDVFSSFDKVIAICDWNKKMLRQLGCSEDKIVMHYNGIDVDFFSPDGGTEREDRPMRILTVARLTDVKNIPFAIEVMRKLLDGGIDDFEYLVIGEGPEREKIEALIESLEISNSVKLLGALPREQVVEYMRKSDIFFLPSKDEAFPTVLLEAHSCSLPVVAIDVAGVGETFLNGESGILLPKQDVNLAADVLQELLKDEERRKKMGHTGREFILKRHSLNVVNERLEELYISVIGLRQNSGRL